MERTTLYWPKELKESITAIAKRRGCSLSEVVRDALSKHVVEPAAERPWPTSFGSSRSGEVHADDLDEWLAANRERD